MAPTLTDHLWSHVTDKQQDSSFKRSTTVDQQTYRQCREMQPLSSRFLFSALIFVQCAEEKKSLCFMRPVVWLKTFRDINPFK